MRKVLIIGVAFLILLTSIIIAVAKNDVEKDIEKNLSENIIQAINQELEKEFLKAKIEIKRIKNKNLQDLTISDSLKIYNLNEPDIVKSYDEGKGFGSLISDNYSWIFKVNDASGDSNIVLKINEDISKDEYRLIGFSYNHVVSIDTFLSLKELKKIISKTDIESIDDLKYVQVPMYHINILYIKSDKDEYALAFDSRPDLTGLRKGIVYKMRDLIDTLDKNFNR